MEIRFKSSECNGRELVKSFNKDFETSFLSEKEYSDFKHSGSGIVKEIHLNNAFVLFQDQNIQNSENHTIQVVQNHPVFLLQIVIDGDVTFSFNENICSEFNLNKNMYNLFYIPPSKNVYKYLNHKKRILNIYFTAPFLECKMGTCFLKNSKKYQQAKKENELCCFFNKGLVLNRQLRNIVNDFLTCSYGGVIKQSYLESKLTELLLIALASNDSDSIINKLRKEDRESLVRIESYIRSHLETELSIKNLSELAGFNTSKFKTVFKQVYGIPVFQYITSLRIEKAMQLISKHDYTIAQASYEVGYKNPQHFTVAFKKKLGYLPSQLINNGQ
ncbi:AraC family transcriptional regulator [Bizionia argentinensis JUB59]|uniref:AraC family transcriptional regulator n=1 Tax=Bizionia argentinensis JUB59 TaxID=1046627 RepID=G2EB22_9FLAO|nr:AraC family transcriptional regulator [Bizionia argentinensis]EGV44236.1 AraC family transcriptional regulator [Bizionia argentinensis JUB59]